MNFVLKSGLSAVALLTLCAPVFAANSQTGATGPHHDLNMSVQNSNPTLTAPMSNTCGAASGRPDVVAGGTKAAGNMTAQGAATPDADISDHGDKCSKSAGAMTPAAPAAPATH